MSAYIREALTVVWFGVMVSTAEINGETVFECVFRGENSATRCPPHRAKDVPINRPTRKTSDCWNLNRTGNVFRVTQAGEIFFGVYERQFVAVGAALRFYVKLGE